MKIAIPKEIAPGELRVAATPDVVKKLLALGGVEVLVQSGAGEGAAFDDSAYESVGAKVVRDVGELWSQADLVLKVRAPTELPQGGHEIDRLREGAWLIGFIWPGQNPSLVERMAKRKLNVLAVDAIPRISRAQKMDALSAMANIAGYRAVIEAASRFGRFFPGQVTAAGRVKPAEVLVIGAGVAGLAAIATARSLGAQVRAFDTRPAVREQVQSLGARFLDFHVEEPAEGEGGYARKMSEAFIAAEQELIAKHAAEVDVVITTAVIPGAPAPLLITSGAVVGMRRGSVIVDLAAEQGGNCAHTERDRVVERFGVTIVGRTDLVSAMAPQASELYAQNVLALLQEIVKDGKIVLDKEDEVHRGVLVLEDGKLMWPPPSRPKPKAQAPLHESLRPAPAKAEAPPPSPWRGPLALASAATLLLVVGAFAPPELLAHLTVFLLACVVGWHVVWNVTPALHTPLMSVTNAVSGIILIGGVLLLHDTSPSSLLGAVAVLIATINVAGGFLVTARMLKMFRSEAQAKKARGAHK
jgi:NAD(P) transhydrogenase subunit alpha